MACIEYRDNGSPAIHLGKLYLINIDSIIYLTFTFGIFNLIMINNHDITENLILLGLNMAGSG